MFNFLAANDFSLDKFEILLPSKGLICRLHIDQPKKKSGFISCFLVEIAVKIYFDITWVQPVKIRFFIF